MNVIDLMIESTLYSQTIYQIRCLTQTFSFLYLIIKDYLHFELTQKYKKHKDSIKKVLDSFSERNLISYVHFFCVLKKGQHKSSDEN